MFNIETKEVLVLSPVWEILISTNDQIFLVKKQGNDRTLLHLGVAVPTLTDEPQAAFNLLVSGGIHSTPMN